LDIGQPELNTTFSLNDTAKSNVLVFGRVHTVDDLRARLLTELNLFHRVETLNQVRLHSVCISGLRQNFQHFIIGQEVEARERSSLR